ncbi:MAG: FkbM family methyltransferase [Rhodobacterales bacterium]|nr:FkbM family methyltransferase [Rhodobacterales bacterium]
MRHIDRIRYLHDLVRADRKTVVVDVGANPLGSPPIYSHLRKSGVARIIGFEPQPKALEALNAAAGPHETYLPYALGSGTEETLHLTKDSGLVSTLEPDPWIAAYLSSWWRKAIEVRETLPITTRRLDDITEIDRIDFLKIDIQGGELNVFRNAREKLGTASLIQTEIPLIRYYKDQPSFGDVQSELESQGFLAHQILQTRAHYVGYPLKLAEDFRPKASQTTVVDLAFLRNPTSMDALPLDTVQHMAILADAVLHSHDLVLRCLGELVRRQVVDAPGIGEYINLVRNTLYSK